jgi:hypothetical protein
MTGSHAHFCAPSSKLWKASPSAYIGGVRVQGLGFRVQGLPTVPENNPHTLW